MKHVTASDKSFMVGDEAANVLMDYAALIARTGGGDTVELRAYDSTGEDTVITLLLDQGSALVAESRISSIPEPDNADAVQHMREAMRAAQRPIRPSGARGDEADDFVDYESDSAV
jgi:hypothetical protein